MSSRKEKLLEKLNPKFLKMTPRLSGVTGTLIDLDFEEKRLEDGAKELMMRFIKNQDLSEKLKQNAIQKDVELTVTNTICDENEQICELISEKLKCAIRGDNEIEEVYEKPGRKLQKLKQELQDKMSAKWEEEYKKRVSERSLSSQKTSTKDKEVLHKKSNKVEEDIRDSETEDGDSDNSATSDDGDDGDDGDDDNDDENNDSDNESSKDDGNNDDEKEDAGNKSDNEDLYGSYDECSLVPPYQPGGGLLYGGSELTQCEEELPSNLLSPSLKFSFIESPNSKTIQNTTIKTKEVFPSEEPENSFLRQNQLFAASQNVTDSFDLTDAFEFCSGKFPETGECDNLQVTTQSSVRQELTISRKFNLSEKVQNSFEKDCDKLIASSSKDLIKTKTRIKTPEESETENSCGLDEVEESDFTTSKVMPDIEEDSNASNAEVVITKNRKMIRTLQFSDEEDETRDGETDNESVGLEEEADDAHDEEDDQRSINYDSEENEIVNAKEFFEREAELSGSEWSGDEDERGLDKYDHEEGDADNLDQLQVRSQLEKIHLRQVLDDDAREVRLIQELFFEDGDLHSDGKRRDRKFKWKNLGAFDDKGNEGHLKEEGGNSSEEDCAEEEQFRKSRYEKELFLMQMKDSGNVSSDDDIVGDSIQKSKITTIKNLFKLPVKSRRKLDDSKSIKNNPAELKPLAACNARGSFLKRNEEFLSKLAKTTSSVADNVLGPKNSKNFVFASKSPEKSTSDKKMVSKRQVEDSERLGHHEKKIKLVPAELFSAGPSILDLMA